MKITKGIFIPYCVGDFGIAIENQNTQDLHSGTQSYYAPEQALDIFTDKYDHRVDIYSLGLVLYELADTIPVALRYNDRIYNQYLPDLGKSVSQGLNAIIHKACQFDPGDRYQNASAFKRDLNLLQKDPGYVPDFPTVQSHEGDFQIENHKKGVSNNTAYSSGQKGSPYKRKKIQSRHAVHDLSIPETMWYAGKFWYDKSSEHGSRFEFLNIDRQIMPSSVHSGGSGTDLPVNVYVHSKKQGQVKPLSEIIEDTEHIHNMYLIGEGGIGKTTALYSIMENAYKNMQYHPSDTKKTIIPLFIELSKAPLEYGPVYTSMRSSFIHCYVYMLIRSLSNKQLILEDNAEMLHIMQNSSEEAVCQVNTILKNTPDNIEYLLLLDGLNEVSRKPVYMNGSANISESPVEMITAEIQELLAHQNIRIIITSRSDEYLDEMENSFEKYYLTGIDNNTIYSYLGRNHVPVENIKNNSRLLDTLRVPLFLKLYCQLYSVNEVSTPGEILYTYFSERSTMYTARKRIQEIKKDRTATGMPYTSNIINEKTQWFILDFLLPEIGWYMEKNGLFTIDQQTIKSIIDPILTGTDLTDICGKYGISLFKDYHKGNDGTINVKTYADYLVSLHIDGKSYIQEIIDYCVYSFGILCVNNQHYSFIHQHIRDFFASMKIITNMKLATYIATSSSDNELGRHCLTCLTSELLSEDIVRFIGEILGEYQNVPVYVDGKWESCKTNEIKSSVLNVNSRFLITDALKLFQNYFPEENNIDYGVWNLLKIIYTARKTLAAMNLKNLDLRGCSLNNLELYDADLSGSLIYHENIFPNAYQEKQVWDDLLSGTGNFTTQDPYSRLKDMISKQLEQDHSVYLVSRSIPKHLDLFYFLNSTFPDIPVYLDPKSQRVADTLSDMGYQVYTPNIHISETIPEKACIIIGQEQNRQGCVSILFDAYSLHASIPETLTLIRQLMPDSLYLLHVHPIKGKLSLNYVADRLLPDVSVTQTVNSEKYYLKRTKTMKYDLIYQSVMEEELKIAEGQMPEYGKGRHKSTYEWIAIYGSLLYPSLHPHETYDKLQKTFIKEAGISYDDYRSVLHSSNLDNEDRRRYVLNIIENDVTLLKSALDGDTEAISHFSEFTENLNPRDRKNGRIYFIGKCMVIFMILIDPDLKQ